MLEYAQIKETTESLTHSLTSDRSLTHKHILIALGLMELTLL